MYKNRELLRIGLAKRFGFFQPSATAVTNGSSLLSPSLSSSTDDQWVNEVHTGLITPENIEESITNFMRFPHPAWDVATTYTKGDLVTEASVGYEYVNDADSAGNLVADTAFWFQLNNVNEYLHQKRFQAAIRAIDTVFNDKKMRAKVKSIYDNIALFDGLANYNNVQANQNNFVGLRFRMKSDRSLVTTINKISTQFTEAIGNITLYLYHSSQQEPITTFTVNHTKANSSIWTILAKDGTNELRYLDDSYDAGGEFFLGYAQSDLGTAQALRMNNIDWIGGNGCGECPGDRSYRWHQNYSNFVDVIGFSVPESFFTVGVDLFNPVDAAISASENFGLNINMSNECDLTPFFLDNGYLLSEAMRNVAGFEVLRDMAGNTRGANGRANQVAVSARNETLQVDGVYGTVRDLTEASLKGLSFDLSGLNDACVPCDDGSAQVIRGTVTLR